MSKTKYRGVYVEKNKFYYLAELGIDKVTGKRIQRKRRRSREGKPFKTAYEAYKELTVVRNEYLEQNGYANYRLTYGLFMEESYISAYKADVEESTFQSRKSVFKHLIRYFGNTELRNITVLQCEQYRTYLLNDSSFSQGFSHLVYGTFRRSLDYAVKVGFLDYNISKKTKPISKGKAVVPFWTKKQFEKVLSVIYTKEYYEHMCFVVLWVYFMTGVRVGEGQALRWDDVDFDNQKIKIHHNLYIRNKTDYRLKPYTKTENGMRTISIDADTAEVLSDWKDVQKRHGVKHFIMSYDDTPIVRSTIQRIIKRYAKIADVPVIQTKGLRHSHVSYLINEFNIDVLNVSQRLGHSSPEITLRYYAHLWRGNDKGLADLMTGNIKFEPAENRRINFKGNQTVN